VAGQGRYGLDILIAKHGSAFAIPSLTREAVAVYDLCGSIAPICPFLQGAGLILGPAWTPAIQLFDYDGKAGIPLSERHTGFTLLARRMGFGFSLPLFRA
jgi:hypothetical protein